MEHRNDSELRELLREWEVPAASPSLESRLLKTGRPWWHSLVHGYIRVPVPVACCLALFMIGGAWRLATPPKAGCSTASVSAPAIEKSARRDHPDAPKQRTTTACAVDSSC
jgi:hypothetical protein